MNKTISLDEQKAIMLDMMDFIDAFCRKNNIRYYLYGGSLIGAIRHHGYIPWDDDIDICMMRADYDKFLNSFFDEKKRYILISPESNSNYYLPTAKIYDSSTELDEHVPGGIKIGVFIDVFPLDYCFDEYTLACRYGKRIGIYRTIVDIKNISYSRNRSAFKNIVLFFSKLLVIAYPKRIAISKICKLSKKYSSQKTKYVGQFTKMTYKSREVYESKWFDYADNSSFEGRQYMIPREYDAVLKTEFGDYMKLPPAEKRITHHSNDAWLK